MKSLDWYCSTKIKGITIERYITLYFNSLGRKYYISPESWTNKITIGEEYLSDDERKVIIESIKDFGG